MSSTASNNEAVLLAWLQAIDAIGDDITAMSRAGKRITKALKAGDLQRGKPLRIALLSSFLTDILKEVLVFQLFTRGITAEVVVAPYGAIAADLLSPQSITQGCDLLVLCPTHRDLLQCPPLGSTAVQADAAAQAEAAAWAQLWQKAPCPIVQLSFDPPPTRALAELDGFHPGGPLNHVRRVNQHLFDLAGKQVSLVDAEALASSVGSDWHDQRNYFLFKQPFGQKALAVVASALASTVAARQGRARKALVLDLDNTLWGGIIGDAGISGIEVGKESADGEAFSAFQSYVKGLSERGVILAVCSKNREEAAKSPFLTHSGMVLGLQDIACFVANFEDKASNIRKIAKTLNIGLDSLVFADDSPVERALVKQELPMVLVVDMPIEPSGYIAALERTFSFPLLALTNEDIGRNRSYAARAAVSEAQSKSTDIDSFLKGLSPSLSVEGFTPQTIDRVTQLLAKTNQFKLNAEALPASLLGAPETTVLAVSFADRLQAYGIVSVVVLQDDGQDLVITNWVMSCRVFSRRLEIAILELIRTQALQCGRHRIVARFAATGKNEVARDHLLQLGFVPDATGQFTVAAQDQANLPAHHIDFNQITLKAHHGQ